ncbi:hypothetical protein HK414_21240 [Ramlibacter terrae]|uniref:Uncharacterized protein n=1 Tax=Ramlibacter terrae TaxID=2732511 RepID=A0ABX6P6W6_9BURK|nr:hypothetical protein HK414_21240 [Ramlibacter terrae]
MLTLRSPKHLTGPDTGVPSLTFRAWYEAQHGGAGWEALHKIGRIDWRDYLLWVRDTCGLRVENGTALLSVDDQAGLLRVRLGSAAGEETVWTRKLVLALGRDGSGAARWPAFPSLRRDDPARPRASSTRRTRSTSPGCAASKWPCWAPAPPLSTTRPAPRRQVRGSRCLPAGPSCRR